MFLFDALIAIARFLISWFWLPFVDQSRERDEPMRVVRDDARDGDAADRVAVSERVGIAEVLTNRHADDLENGARQVQSRVRVDSVTRIEGGHGSVEDDVSDTFLSQLEQRTQQVKITLANLEAEKARIESQIAQLQPLIPHYDALLEAERAIAGAQIDFDAPGGSDPTSGVAHDDSSQDAAATAEGESPLGEPTAQGSNWTSYNP